MQLFSEIPEFLIPWIEKQEMFFVASAPLAADGLVNISPKGIKGSFHVENPRKVWYEDLSGTGVETIAHIRENGRVTIMFNAYEGPPRITRLYGKGSVHEFGSPEYNALLPEGIRHAGSRAAIVLDLIKVSTVRDCLFTPLESAPHSACQTCGYSVPLYEFKSHRGQLLQWAAEKEATDREYELAQDFSSSSSPRAQTGLKQWWKERNTKSLEGQKGLVSAPMTKQVFKPTTNTPSGDDKWDIATSSNSSSYFNTMGAFLLGILLALSYGHFMLVAQHLFKDVDISFNYDLPNLLS